MDSHMFFPSTHPNDHTPLHVMFPHAPLTCPDLCRSFPSASLPIPFLMAEFPTMPLISHRLTFLSPFPFPWEECVISPHSGLFPCITAMRLISRTPSLLYIGSSWHPWTHIPSTLTEPLKHKTTVVNVYLYRIVLANWSLGKLFFFFFCHIRPRKSVFFSCLVFFLGGCFLKICDWSSVEHV